MSRPTRRYSVIVLVVLVVGGVLGGLLGGRASAELDRPEDKVWTISRMFALVEDRYVGKLESEELVEQAIQGMLQRLDPHSNYLPPDAFSEMRDEQRGKFSGLGIQITKRGPEKPLTIIAPIDGTPAHRAGLQSGDVISEIESQPTIDMTVHEAVRLLKGDKGTRVTITIERPGLPDPFDVTIERDDIPIESIRVAFMLTPEVGLVRISNFTSTTADELDAAVERLEAQGMQRLLLDLRSNPGGLLDQAVQVAERFLAPGKRIVYTRGRIPGSNQDYFAKRGAPRFEMPLVLLVDHSSASASEIVSGAVQDHDRGLVVGETTFGKGLVQRVLPLHNTEGAVAVTTAMYYTPAGRLIQRDYSDLDDYYAFDTAFGDDPEDADARGLGVRPGDTEESGPEPGAAEDDAEPSDEREVFLTASGRKVYGGGGIRPDEIVRAPKTPPVLLKLLRQNAIFDYAVQFSNARAELERDFEIDDATLADLRRFIAQRDVEIGPAEFEESRDLIALRLRAQIARVRWDQNEEARILAQADPQVQRAVALFDEAAALARRGAEGEPGASAESRDPLSRAAR